MDPLPSVSRVFSLVIQEEKQRMVNAIPTNNTETLAYAIHDSNGSKSKNGKKDRTMCSHCGVVGHIKDKCFKLHGYSPGYKKAKSTATSNSAANAVNPDNIEDGMPLNTKQYEQLIAYTQGQMDNLKEKVIGTSEYTHGLYFLKIESECTSVALDFCSNKSMSTIPSCNSVSNVFVSTWHARLGHLSDQVLQMIHNNVPDLVPLNASHHDFCKICPLPKFHHLPFTSNNNHSALPFDLIHCDVWGPFSKSIYDGHNYFLTNVDDNTRYEWIHLMKHKSKETMLFKLFFKFIKTQFNTSIKETRSDNAKELQLTDFLQTEGAIHHFSCPHRPQ
ncbi:uncharacterized protein LOC131598630 [Vicia villosa]|uniref:uncharacterized protein LOC131598630 n=1 Tax=Vicia villosa TaxID=3911 RepID=UPI00273CC88C|nr:uncharacterized protein LOC131598630 [Vicia villosa]